MTTRVCTFCKIEKDISNFTKRGGVGYLEEVKKKEPNVPEAD